MSSLLARYLPPHDSHAALATTCVVPGQPQKAPAKVDAALKLDPNIRINAAVLRAAVAGNTPAEH